MLCLDFIIYISNIEFEFYWNLFSKYIFLILGMIEDGNQTENAENMRRSVWIRIPNLIMYINSFINKLLKNVDDANKPVLFQTCVIRDY